MIQSQRPRGWTRSSTAGYYRTQMGQFLSPFQERGPTFSLFSLSSHEETFPVRERFTRVAGEDVPTMILIMIQER